MKNRVFNRACRLASAGRKVIGRGLQVAGAGAAFAGSAVSSFAQTDITSTVSTLSGYWDSIETLGIGVLLFVVGRKLVRKA